MTVVDYRHIADFGQAPEGSGAAALQYAKENPEQAKAAAKFVANNADKIPK